ncbi:MAG: hypothetical protein GXY83_26740 [Rhodopirellula sp.]|nr:hypothetical protein [Rhodopirellula sp.]
MATKPSFSPIKRGFVASAGQVIPSRGEGITAAGRALEEWNDWPGERRGHCWWLFKQKKSPQRTLVSDTNYWKSQIRNGIVAAHGDPNSIGLNGDLREADFQ